MSAAGVTCAICCCNSASRLPETLASIGSQETSLPVEVLVVDNGSVDNTAAVARQVWKDRPGFSLRILREDRPGLSYARLVALSSAAHEVVTFVDDDNSLAEDWVSRLHGFMRDNPETGAIGGLNTAASSEPLPGWFPAYQSVFAVGPQAEVSGDVTETSPLLFGAGLSIRSAAFSDLLAAGFSPALADRSGTQLSSAGDYELTLALALRGWRLSYEPELKLLHRIAPERLHWSHLRSLERAASASGVLLDPYIFALGHRKGRQLFNIEKSWAWKLALSAVRVSLYSSGRQSRMPGRRSEILYERAVGRFRGLIHHRKSYHALHTRLRVFAQKPKQVSALGAVACAL
jgi:glycosyltransferase involved in cell wall biosynthesis